MNQNKKTENKKLKPLSFNIKPFLNAKTKSTTRNPFTLKQLDNLQKTQINNMIRVGRSATDINEFVKKVNKVKRTIGKPSLTATGRKNIGNLFNSFDKKRVDYQKGMLVVNRAPHTRYNRHFGAKIDDKDIKTFRKMGILSKSSENLIRQRNKNPNIRELTLRNKKEQEIYDIIKVISKSRVDIYIEDIKRIAFDYLGIEIDSNEDIEKIKQIFNLN